MRNQNIVKSNLEIKNRHYGVQAQTKRFCQS